MLSMPLPEISATAASKWKDAAACQRWLGELPLTNAGQAQQALNAELARFLRVKMPPLERMKVLEQLRESVAHVQTECARKYAGKPLPMLETESAQWKQTLALWQNLRAGYQRCLLDALGSSGEAARHAALLCQRCLRYTAATIVEYYLVNLEVDAELWRHLYALYALAEKNGCAEEAVQDKLMGETSSTNCTVACVRALLISLGNPYSLSPKQIELAGRWIDQWGEKVKITVSAPSHAAPVFDLAGTSGAAAAAETNNPASLRYLVTEDLGMDLMKRIVRLEKGQAPAELGLGSDCMQPACEALVKMLFQQWCRTARIAPRRAAGQKVQLCAGLAGAHYFVSGNAFKQPGKLQLSRQEEEELRMFGHVSKHREAKQLSQLGFALESWETVNDSVQGTGWMRAPDGGNARLSLNQLIAAGQGGKDFLLCVVQWITQKAGGELHIGVRVLPGIPEPVAVRPSGSGTGASYVQAFLLPDVAALNIEPSLILPNGWFQTGRIIDVYTSESQRIKLIKLIEKGADYDRVDFGAP
ncbi:MAG: hypothetical protein ACREUV_00295 [Burkholderiales bacterium]